MKNFEKYLVESSRKQKQINKKTNNGKSKEIMYNELGVSNDQKIISDPLENNDKKLKAAKRISKKSNANYWAKNLSDERVIDPINRSKNSGESILHKNYNVKNDWNKGVLK